MSLRKLLEMEVALRLLTPEQQDQLNKRMQESERKQQEAWIKRHTCSECGADTWNYSHSFTCVLRGSGF